MMVRVLLLVAAMAQTGCAAAIYAESRKVTREGITPPLATLAPGVQTEAAATCVMKGLSQVELLELPNSGTLDDAARAEAFVTSVLARPGVAACIAAAPRTTG
ncbi:MAG: hypothetical protein ACT4OK_06440 [Gemmobacter sp.]